MFGKNVPACPVWVRSSFQFLKVSPYLVTYHWNGLVTTTLSKVVKVDQFDDLKYMINIEMDMKVGGSTIGPCFSSCVARPRLSTTCL